MAEWYDVNGDLEAGLCLLDELLQSLLETPQADRIGFAQAFEQATGLSLFDCDIPTLGRWAVEQKLIDRVDWSDDWDDWVNLIFSTVVQPSLGQSRPVLVTHFPASQARLPSSMRKTHELRNAMKPFIAASSWPMAITSCAIPRSSPLARRWPMSNASPMGNSHCPWIAR